MAGIDIAKVQKEWDTIFDFIYNKNMGSGEQSISWVEYCKVYRAGDQSLEELSKLLSSLIDVNPRRFVISTEDLDKIFINAQYGVTLVKRINNCDVGKDWQVLTGYKPLPSYPNLVDKVTYEIFGHVTEVCPFCGTKFVRKVMEKHIVFCEISKCFDDYLLLEVEYHPARQFIAQTIQRHSGWHLFFSTDAFKEADEREQDLEDSKAFDKWCTMKEDGTSWRPRRW